MAARSDKHNVSPDQGELFDLFAQAAPESVGPTTPLSDLDYLTEPVAVDVAKRAEYIGLALKALNAANSRAGLQSANATPHREEIGRRYGSATSAVIAGAELNEGQYMRKARRHLDIASGRYALAAAGLPGERAAQLAAREFQDFRGEFGIGIADAPIRNKTAKNLQASADYITGKRNNLPRSWQPRKPYKSR